MLRFKVYDNGSPAKQVNLEGACLLGSERVPVRAEIKFAGGCITCEPRTRGAVALCLPWPVAGMGKLMLETVRLLDRAEPYNLHVELARGQLMRISQKREDWGLYDFAEGREIYAEIDAARDTLVAAITAPDEPGAARLGDASLSAGMKVGETLGKFHADLFLKRRRPAATLAKRPIGCRLLPAQCNAPAFQKMGDNLDHVSLPFGWTVTEPHPGKFETTALEQCANYLKGRKLTLFGHSLLSFDRSQLPAWLIKSAKDFDTFRELAERRIRHFIKTFAGHVSAFEIVSGIHAANPFKLPLDQIMDLTRMSAILLRQHAPKTVGIIGLTHPWGEYYASDHQTVPPFLYAEMVVQNGISFDAFGVELRFGFADDGQYMRDIMQLSALLDRLGTLGKPVHVTAAGVPATPGDPKEGSWHGAWNEEVQAEWMEEIFRVALSKPFVETVSWHSLTDDAHAGGLFRADLTPKPVLERLAALRKELKAQS
jgi:hypothetical protein